MDNVATARHRPSSVTTLAILNFIFAALCLLCGGAVVVRQAIIPDRNGTAPEIPARMADAYVQGSPLWDLAISVETLIGGVILVVLGIGLLLMQRWARLLALAYGTVTILVQLGYILFKVSWGYMAFQQLAGSPPAMRHMVIAFGPRVVWVGLLLMHALALVIIMQRSVVAAAFEEERR